MTTQEIWTRIETWLASNAPDVLNTLNPGASEDAIEEAQETLGVTFPADVKESYKLHDGQNFDGPTLMPNGEFLSLDGMKAEWRIWKRLLDDGDFDGSHSSPEEGIKNNWWNAAWLPITSDGAGNHSCLDLDPAPGGHIGQVIAMWHDSEEREIEAPSYTAWLEKLAHGLESGEYVYSEELSPTGGNYGGIVHKDDVQFG